MAARQIVNEKVATALFGTKEDDKILLLFMEKLKNYVLFEVALREPTAEECVKFGTNNGKKVDAIIVYEAPQGPLAGPTVSRDRHEQVQAAWDFYMEGVNNGLDLYGPDRVVPGHYFCSFT